MDDSQIYLDGAQRLKQVIESQFGNLFNAYFIGQPDAIPAAAMPCVIFHKIAGTVQIGPTGTDELTEQVLIHIMIDGKEGFGSPEDDDTVMRKLSTLVEGRDPATGTFNTASIMYAIRRNLTLNSSTGTAVGSRIINHSEETQYYDMGFEPDQPTLVQAVVTVTIDERVTVANRV